MEKDIHPVVDSRKQQKGISSEPNGYAIITKKASLFRLFGREIAPDLYDSCLM
ncbi:MAG TPA: hypothetical protein VE912_19775 [Bacteroidales bacterium]|nr:hypothetical protein [Bacteroidales bacterium]